MVNQKSEWQRIDELFKQANRLPSDERVVFFARLAASEPQLADEVQSLLSHGPDTDDFSHQLLPGLDEAGDILEDGIDDTLLVGESSEQGEDQTDRLARLKSADKDRYELRECVGSGGQGTVFEVWDEALRRRLAMKVLLEDAQRGDQGSGTRAATLSRFLEEAQITGQLDHPGIVPVHDLGLDSNGQVYFTMRLVRGDTLNVIIRKIHEQQDGWTQVRGLSVVLKACEAVAYAHSKGVIHRDLKPTNLMVGRYGEVYVMDWGIARVLGRDDTHDLRIKDEPPSSNTLRTDRRDSRDADEYSPLVTLDGMVMGTPSFMPPEQADGRVDEMGPASDVYSMGAVLYQLLTGRLPYAEQKTQLSARGILAAVLEGPPTPIAELAPRTPRELISICEKAMARAREDRYPNMEAFATDLRDFEELRVEEAKRSKELDEIVKFQHDLLAEIDVPQMASNLRQQLRERVRDAQQARHSKSEAEESLVNLEQLLEGVDFTGMALSVLKDNIFARALEGVTEQFVDAPLVRAQLFQDIAKILRGLGLSQMAHAPQQDALEIRRRVFGEAHPDTVKSQGSLATVLWDLGRFSEAEACQRAALTAARRVHGNNSMETVTWIARLGKLLNTQGRHDEAEPYYREALETSRRVLGPEHRHTIMHLQNLGSLLMHKGQLAAAEGLYREAMATLQNKPSSADDMNALRNNLGYLYSAKGELAKAEDYFRQALKSRREVLGHEHPRTLLSLNNLASLLRNRGRAEDALRLHHQAVRLGRKKLGARHWYVGVYLRSRGETWAQMNQLEDAVNDLQQCYSIFSQSVGSSHPRTRSVIPLLVSCYEAWHEAEPDAGHDRSAASWRRQLPTKHPRAKQ